MGRAHVKTHTWNQDSVCEAQRPAWGRTYRLAWRMVQKGVKILNK